MMLHVRVMLTMEFKDFDFKTLSDGSTFVTIKHYGFDKTGDELTWVLGSRDDRGDLACG